MAYKLWFACSILTVPVGKYGRWTVILDRTIQRHRPAHIQPSGALFCTIQFWVHVGICLGFCERERESEQLVNMEWMKEECCRCLIFITRQYSWSQECVEKCKSFWLTRLEQIEACDGCSVRCVNAVCVSVWLKNQCTVALIASLISILPCTLHASLSPGTCIFILNGFLESCIMDEIVKE